MNEPKKGDRVMIRHPDGSVTDATMVFVSPAYVRDVAKRQQREITALMRRQQEMFRRSKGD